MANGVVVSVAMLAVAIDRSKMNIQFARVPLSTQEVLKKAAKTCIAKRFFEPLAKHGTVGATFNFVSITRNEPKWEKSNRLKRNWIKFKEE